MGDETHSKTQYVQQGYEPCCGKHKETAIESIEGGGRLARHHFRCIINIVVQVSSMSLWKI